MNPATKVESIPDWFYDMLAYIAPSAGFVLLLAITFKLPLDGLEGQGSVIQVWWGFVGLCCLYIYGQLISTLSHYIKRMYSQLLSGLRWPYGQTTLPCRLRGWFNVDPNSSAGDLRYRLDVSDVITNERRASSSLYSTSLREIVVAYFRLEHPKVGEIITKSYARTKISRAMTLNTIIYIAIVEMVMWHNMCLEKLPDRALPLVQWNMYPPYALALGFTLLVVFAIEYYKRERWLGDLMFHTIETHDGIEEFSRREHSLPHDE